MKFSNPQTLFELLEINFLKEGQYLTQLVRKSYYYFFVLFLIGIGFINAISGQELEPRSLTNTPVGTNFVVAGYGYVNGNILFDPALPLEDTKAQLHTFVGAYVRTIDFFGLSGKLDVVTTYGNGNWKGNYMGVDTSTSRSGFGDLRFRFSFNFTGAPALRGEDFQAYKPKTISGFSIQVIAPTGQYFPDRLINLGSNRWVFKPQLGFAQNYENWILESLISAWFFTTNNDFWGGDELRQDPLLAFKIHGVRKLPHRMWLAMSLGYAVGAQGYVNDVLKDNRVSTIRLGLTYAIPVGQHHTVRIIGVSGIRLEKGADFDSVSLLYQYRWNNRS